MLSRTWVEELIEQAESDADYRHSARSLNASLHLHDEERGFTIRFTGGRAAEILDGEVAPVDFHLGGSSAQWAAALADAPDVSAATSPANGLTLRGDAIAVAGSALALRNLWVAMRASAVAADSGGARPAPVAEGRPAEQVADSARSAEIVGRYTQVAGYRVYYETAGTGYPIVCIHTGGADGRQYRHLLDGLGGSDYRVIAVDMPGHGKSYPDLATRAPIRTAQEWIDFVLAFSRQLGLDRPVYVGCAMSASLLLRLAAEHPRAAAAVVGANANADFTKGWTPEALDVLNHPQVNAADLLESMTLGLLGRELPTDVRNECLWHNARNLTPEVMQADLTIYAAHDIRAELDRIEVPVLHLKAEFDGSVDADNLTMIRDGIRGVTMEQLPGIGHIPMLENPPLFNQHVDRFLRTVVPTATNPDQLAVDGRND